jgi:hypothetical protein
MARHFLPARRAGPHHRGFSSAGPEFDMPHLPKDKWLVELFPD